MLNTSTETVKARESKEEEKQDNYFALSISTVFICCKYYKIREASAVKDSCAADEELY